METVCYAKCYAKGSLLCKVPQARAVPNVIEISSYQDAWGEIKTPMNYPCHLKSKEIQVHSQINLPM